VKGDMPNAPQQLSLRSYKHRLLTVTGGLLCQHTGHSVQGQPPHKLANVHFEGWRSVCAGYGSNQSVSMHQTSEGKRVNVRQALHASEDIQQLHRCRHHSEIPLGLWPLIVLATPKAGMAALSTSA
jgi:hypothetical protein